MQKDRWTIKSDFIGCCSTNAEQQVNCNIGPLMEIVKGLFI